MIEPLPPRRVHVPNRAVDSRLILPRSTVSNSARCQRLAAFVVIVALAANSCGGESEGDAASSAEDSTTGTGSTTTLSDADADNTSSTNTDSETTAATAAESTTASTEASTTEAPSTTDSSACPSGPDLPPDATDSTMIAADLDADGAADDVSTYFVPSDGRWHIRVEWGGGGASDEVITDSGGLAPASPIGAHDVDRDGTPELFARVGSGASAVLIGLYDIAQCELTRATINGEAASFPVGATIQNISGLSCGPVGDLDRLFAQFVSDDNFEGGVEPFALNGAELTPGFGDGATFTGEEAAALAVFDCGGLSL